MVFKLKRTVKLRTWRSLFGFFGFIFVFSNLSARFCRTAFPSRSSYQRQLQIHRSLLRSNAASQLPPLFRLLHIVLWFDVRSDLSQSAAFAPPLSVSSVGQTPVTPLRDFETSLAANAWKAGDLGLTRRWMARALRGLPWEQGRGLLGGREGGDPNGTANTLQSHPPTTRTPPTHLPTPGRRRAWRHRAQEQTGDDMDEETLGEAVLNLTFLTCPPSSEKHQKRRFHQSWAVNKKKASTVFFCIPSPRVLGKEQISCKKNPSSDVQFWTVFHHGSDL